MTELRDKGGVLVDSFLRRSGRQGADFSYCLYAVASVAGSRGRATAVATFAHSGQGDKVMHKFASIAASSAGALFTILVAVPKVDAMAFNNTAGAPEFLAASDYAAKPEHVRRCRGRDCRSHPYEPPAYYWSWGRPWPYYPYYNFGTGQSNFGFAH
jgi:hypothetical protein